MADDRTRFSQRPGGSRLPHRPDLATGLAKMPQAETALTDARAPARADRDLFLAHYAVMRRTCLDLAPGIAVFAHDLATGRLAGSIWLVSRGVLTEPRQGRAC